MLSDMTLGSYFLVEVAALILHNLSQMHARPPDIFCPLQPSQKEQLLPDKGRAPHLTQHVLDLCFDIIPSSLGFWFDP